MKMGKSLYGQVLEAFRLLPEHRQEALQEVLEVMASRVEAIEQRLDEDED
jgi:hypothetical protein